MDLFLYKMMFISFQGMSLSEHALCTGVIRKVKTTHLCLKRWACIVCVCVCVCVCLCVCACVHSSIVVTSSVLSVYILTISFV